MTPSKRTLANWSEWARLSLLLALSLLISFGFAKSCFNREGDVPSVSLQDSSGETAVIELPSAPVRILEHTLEALRSEGLNVKSLRLSDDIVEMRHQIKLLLRDFPNLKAIVMVGAVEGNTWRLELQAFKSPRHDSTGGDLKTLPARYQSRFPVHQVQSRMKSAGYPAVISYATGDYPGNSAYYVMLDELAAEPWSQKEVQAGLLNLPTSTGSAYQDPKEWESYLLAGLRQILAKE